MENCIFSIGHGNKTFEEFLKELEPYGIGYLIDVRSHPFSKWNTAFNQPNLQRETAAHNIIYVYMGDTIGGLPSGGDKEVSCYTYVDHKRYVDYEKIAQQPFFQEGMDRLVTAYEKSLKVAVMCSETRPETCHRSKLIGEELKKRGIPMKHIVGDKLLSQDYIISLVRGGEFERDLFNEVSEGEMSQRLSVRNH